MKREEELITNFQDLQGEVDDKVKIVNKLRKRYKAALSEIKDLEEEHQTEKIWSFRIYKKSWARSWFL